MQHSPGIFLHIVVNIMNLKIFDVTHTHIVTQYMHSGNKFRERLTPAYMRLILSISLYVCSIIIM